MFVYLYLYSTLDYYIFERLFTSFCNGGSLDNFLQFYTALRTLAMRLCCSKCEGNAVERTKHDEKVQNTVGNCGVLRKQAADCVAL